jgi:hypothetical protein
MIYGYTVLSALLGAHFTYFLVHRTKISSVRASSGLTLFFILITLPVHILNVVPLQAAFFGGSFVGMSDSKRLNEASVLFASLVFSQIFSLVSRFQSELGGTLGATAFLSCLIIFLISSRIPRKRLK